MFSQQDTKFCSHFYFLFDVIENYVIKMRSFVNGAWSVVIWNLYLDLCLPFPVAALFKRRGSDVARVMGLRVRIPPAHGCLFLMKIVCHQVEVSASADHPSRGVLPSVVCLSVIVKLR
jgi:hypothetical protein